jgi:hypothetical protein
MFDQYVGLPYLDHGRDRKGLDCWGLLRLIYQEQANIVLPTYSYDTAEDRETAARIIAGNEEPWYEIAEEDVLPLDAVLMKRAGVECHIGVITRRHYVLHIGLDYNDSVVEPYYAMRLKRRVTRFIRHKKMDEFRCRS